MPRKCPFTNCGKLISSQHFACSQHWFALSENHRRAITLAYSKYTSASTSTEGREALKQLQAAQQAAIKAVETK